MDNPIGLHLQVWRGGWSPEEVKPVAEKIAEIGYRHLEIPVRAPETVDADALAKILDANGIEAIGVFAPALDADPADPDPAIAAKGAARMIEGLKKARDLGAKRLIGPLHSALNKYNEARSPAGRRNAVTSLRAVSARAREMGLILCLEGLNRYESNFMNTARQLLGLIKEVGEDNLYCHLDTFHMNIEEADPAAAILEAGDRLGYFHVADNHRSYLGTGSIDFTRIFRALAQAKYEGPISLEVMSSAVVNPAHSAKLAIWRELWSDSEDMSRHAYAFIRSQMDTINRAR